ncbi:F-box domain-containing protein [Medusavirus stheno T3]|uniref:F-box domain-containing protein n=1 Tax=Medusavirus stheno T3 TaxID=3069717 RepID=A0A7S7YEJ1_9VIRU|nr:F-box domain-containing protein [Acanthamoeba castellanii medusavirus]QPB44339.1 F-box domain-containing protein [Medusavirus stheno T3]
MQHTRKRARIAEEDTLCGLPKEIWTHILKFAAEWLQVPFVCKEFYAIFDAIHYEPKRRLTPKARVSAIERSTRVFFKRIAKHRPVDADFLRWVSRNCGEDRRHIPTWKEATCNVFIRTFVRRGGTAEELMEFDRCGFVYHHLEAIASAARAANRDLFRHFWSRRAPGEVKDEKLMDWAFDSGDADFCQEIYDSHLAEKRIVLPFEANPVMEAARRGSVAIFRWTIQYGHAFNPKTISEVAVDSDELGFLRWFHEQYGQPISREHAAKLVETAITHHEVSEVGSAMLEYCLSLWRERRLADDGAMPPETLHAACDNRPLFRWCIKQGATTDFEALIREYAEYNGAVSVAELKSVLDELGIAYMQE